MVTKHESVESIKKISIEHADLLDALGVEVPAGASSVMARHEHILTVTVLAADQSVVSTATFDKAQLMHTLHITADKICEVSMELEPKILLITVHSLTQANYLC